MAEKMAKYPKVNPPGENIDSKALAESMLSDRHLQSSETLDNRALIYKPFVLMEELLEKLKLVNYDVYFCRALRYNPISRHYFALATNPGEQFNYFVSLAAWLLRNCGRQVEQPQESDDPNAIIAVILEGLRALGYKPDFPPSKLKSGFGMQCIWVLDCLSEYVLRLQQFTWKPPEYPAEEMDKADIVENYENVTSKCDDTSLMGVHDDYDDDSDVLGVDELRQLSSHLDHGALGDADDALNREMLESSVDSTEWRLEVERVLPQLRLIVNTESKDWREHVDQMQQYSAAINSCMRETRGLLGRLADDIGRTLDKIASRERYVNHELTHQLAALRAAHNRRADRRETYRQASGGLADKSKHLAELGEELNRIKQEIEERGNSMSDGASLVKIKQAITRTRQEATQMDIRVALLQHILLRQTVNAKLQLRDATVD